MRNREEAQIQEAFFQWVSNIRFLDYKIWAIPNGGSRNVIEAVNLKRQGVKSGVFDVFVAYPREPYHGLFIEFKSSKGKLSPNQKEFMQVSSDSGYKCEIVCSIDGAIELVKQYLGMK